MKISRYGLTIFALYGITTLITLLAPHQAQAWDKDKAWLTGQVGGTGGAPGYIDRVKTKALSAIDSNLNGHVDPGEGTGLTSVGGRKYWLGNDPISAAQGFKDWILRDMFTNLNPFGDLWDCLDFDSDLQISFSGIRWKLTMWWPQFIVHTHPMFQNLYHPLFEILKAAQALLGASLGVNLLPDQCSTRSTGCPPWDPDCRRGGGRDDDDDFGTPDGGGCPFPLPLTYKVLYETDALRFAPYMLQGAPIPYTEAYKPSKYFRIPGLRGVGLGGRTAMAMGHAKWEMKDQLFKKYAILGNLPPIPVPDKYKNSPLNPYSIDFLNKPDFRAAIDSVDLTEPDKEQRYSSSPVGENGHRLEYSMLPAAWAVLWSTLVPALQAFSDCMPSKRQVYPFDSDSLERYYPTRDPWIADMLFSKDLTLEQDYDRWLENPRACTEYKMIRDSRHANIPFNMFEVALLPDLLTPMDRAESRGYDRMCTQRLGSNVPFSVDYSLQSSDFLTSLQNIEKAARFHTAYYKEFIEPDRDVRTFFNDFPIDKARDKIQFTYNDNVPTKCQAFGSLGELMPGATTYGEHGEYGLYSATVWQRHTCKIRFGQLAAFLLGLGAIGGAL